MISGINKCNMSFSAMDHTGLGIMVIDDFTGVMPRYGMDINNDGKKELFHGHTVLGALTSAFPPDEELPPISAEQIGSPSMDIWNDSYVNFSFGILSQGFNAAIASPILDFLDNLARVVSKVYVAAGNTREDYNAFNEIPNLISVGGLNMNGDEYSESSQTFIKEPHHRAPYFFKADLVEEEDTPIGYDVYPIISRSGGAFDQLGDGIPDILFTTDEYDEDISKVKLTGENPYDNLVQSFPIQGSSLSSPYKLGKDYQAQHTLVPDGDRCYDHWDPSTDQFVE